MRTLVLIRHAKSSWKDPSRSDLERPLTGRGRSDVQEMGRRMAGRGLVLDGIVTSPARRAKSTAVGMADALGIPQQDIVVDDNMYHGTVQTLLGRIRRLDDDWHVVGLVGHNPGFSDLAAEVSDFSVDTMPTCAVVAMEFDVSSWGEVERGAGRVAFYDYPKNPDAAAS